MLTRRSFLYLPILLVLLSFQNENQSTLGNIGKIIPAFSLRNIDNKIVNLVDYKNAKGFIVVFTCNHCPFAKLYTKRFNELSKHYDSLGVYLLAINSMDTFIYEDESFQSMQKRATAEGYLFPYLQDASQKIGKLFKAKHTPQAFVIWNENNNWIIKYSGAIDDNGENPVLANPYISKAVDELLLNQLVSSPETETFGCRIIYR